MKSFVKKCMAFALVTALMLACMPMTAFAAYDNTHVNTGNQVEDIIAVARTQIGYHEGSLGGTTGGSNNYTKYGVWYDNYFGQSGFSYGAWCAMFVSWCAYQAGIPSDIVYYHAYCPTGVNWWKNKGLWKAAGSYTPKAGDIIYFKDSSGVAGHIGIVTGCSGGYVYTIEGNTSSAIYDPEGNVCTDKSYALSNSRIMGYGTPLYEEGSGTTAAKLGTYKITASSLNVRSGAGTSYGVVGELVKGELAVVTELSNGWGKVTLTDGTTGWCSVADYGEYIGVDALNTDLNAPWGAEHLSYSTSENGSVTFTNTSMTDGIAVDLPLPHKIGNRTTPYFNISVSRHNGGYYFGLTQSGSGYFMMRECTSGDELVVANTASYMQTDESLQIDIGYWWAPEEAYQIDNVRLYLDANSSVTVNYCYFAASAGVVTSTSYNMRKGGSNVKIPDPVNLMLPNTLAVEDRSKHGEYTYRNGMLTIVSEEANGYEVSFNPHVDFTPAQLSRLLFSAETNVRFDIELLVTTSDGERIFSLRDDFYNHFCETPDGDYIPAMNGSAGLDLYSCYSYNQVLPANGVSTIKKVTVRVGGTGTVIINSIQVAANDTLNLFTDSVVVSDRTPDNVPDPVMKGDVNGDGSVSTTDARMILVYLLNPNSLTPDQIQAADYNDNGSVSTVDVREMLSLLLS